jgi:hypothetical protein
MNTNEIKANDSYLGIVSKTREHLKSKKIKSPDLDKLFCVAYNDGPKTRIYVKTKAEFERLKNLRDAKSI